GNAASANGFYVDFAGDGRYVESGQAILGGDDTITGDAGHTAGQSSIQGDYEKVAADGAAFGGNDSINVTGNVAIGDVRDVFGFLSGGNDTLSLLPGGIGATAYGDAFQVAGFGSLVGGSDFIMLAGGSGAAAYGDVGLMQGNADGGNDTIIGSSGADSL